MLLKIMMPIVYQQVLLQIFMNCENIYSAVKFFKIIKNY
jgi:hypothetical protein